MKLDFLNLIESNGYITVSKELARNIGLNETVILAELISQYKYHKGRGELKKGWFYCTIDKLEKNTTLNRYYQTKAIDNLKNLNLIKMERKGLPAKRYFKILENEIKRLFYAENVDKPRDVQIENISQTRVKESNKQEGNSVTNINKNYNNNILIKEEEEGNLSTEKISKKTRDLFQQVFDKEMKPYQVNAIKKYNYSNKMIQKALEVAGKYNAKSLQYLLDMLQDWSNKGISTPEDYERFKRAYKGEETSEDYKAKGYR